jgi:hypothetical protein
MEWFLYQYELPEWDVKPIDREEVVPLSGYNHHIVKVWIVLA